MVKKYYFEISKGMMGEDIKKALNPVTKEKTVVGSELYSTTTHPDKWPFHAPEPINHKYDLGDRINYFDKSVEVVDVEPFCYNDNWEFEYKIKDLNGLEKVVPERFL